MHTYIYLYTNIYVLGVYVQLCTTNFKSDKQVDKTDQLTHMYTDKQYTHTYVPVHRMYLYRYAEYIHSKQQFATLPLSK